MQKGHILQFSCQQCAKLVQFSLLDLDHPEALIVCTNCQKKYILNDSVLKRQLKKFAALCQQIIDSEEILSNTAIGINVGEHHVKVPFKLLLTRFNSSLDLMIGNQPLSIAFRIEPLKDIPKRPNKN